MKLKLLFFFLFGLIFLSNTIRVTYATTVENTAYINTNSVNFRSEPSFTSPINCLLAKDTPVKIIENIDKWYQIELADGRSGWVFQDYISCDEYSNPAKQITSFAKTLLSTVYIYGGTSPKGFDCSGFTMYVFSKFGYKIPHNSGSQMLLGQNIVGENLKEGDLVFFKTLNSNYVNHVGIYLGNHQFIHASSGYGAVRISPLDIGYYATRFQGGRRIIEEQTI